MSQQSVPLNTLIYKGVTSTDEQRYRERINGDVAITAINDDSVFDSRRQITSTI